jgi:hypothetical protein
MRMQPKLARRPPARQFVAAALPQTSATTMSPTIGRDGALRRPRITFLDNITL